MTRSTPLIAALTLACLNLTGLKPAQAQTVPFEVPTAAEFRQTLEAIRAAAAPLDELYVHGLGYAAAQELNGESQPAAVSARNVEAALATAEEHTPIPFETKLRIAEARRRYTLLGHPLPNLPLAESLFAANETPRINREYGSATILFLFPDDCGVCVEMARGLRVALFRSSDRDIHLYGLLAEPPHPVPAPGAPPIPLDPGRADARLRGTPTLTVPPATVQLFGAPTYPLAIATDRYGIVRYIGQAPLTALTPGGFADQLAAHIARVWPQNGTSDLAKPARK